MIVEMRTYQTKPGMRTRFIEIFEAKTRPEHERLGIRIAGPFPSVEDADIFFFMRGFPDLESRETMKIAFYEGRLWKEELEAMLMPMLEHYDVVVVDDAEGRIAW